MGWAASCMYQKLNFVFSASSLEGVQDITCCSVSRNNIGCSGFGLESVIGYDVPCFFEATMLNACRARKEGQGIK